MKLEKLLSVPDPLLLGCNGELPKFSSNFRDLVGISGSRGMAGVTSGEKCPPGVADSSMSGGSSVGKVEAMRAILSSIAVSGSADAVSRKY